MVARSFDAIMVINILKQIQKEIQDLREDVDGIKNAFARLEETGLNINIYERSDSESSGAESVESAPF